MPSREPTRRQILSAGGLATAATLGGCLRAFSIDSTESSQHLVLSLSELEGSLRGRYVVDLTETRPSWDETAFNATLDGSTFETRHRTPFLARSEAEPTYARRNGTYYRLDSRIVDEERVTHPVLRLYEVADERDVTESVSHSSLPEVDMRAVQVAYFAARARGNKGGVPWGLVERDGYVYRDAEAIAASVLLRESGPSYVEHRERVYEVTITSETFHEAVYRADVDPVADSNSTMETILRAAVLDARVSGDALSGAERNVLEEATRDSYSEPHPYSAAFESVLKKLDHWAYLDGDVEKDGGVESGRQRRHLLYDDRYFSYTLRFVSDE